MTRTQHSTNQHVPGNHRNTDMGRYENMTLDFIPSKWGKGIIDRPITFPSWPVIPDFRVLATAEALGSFKVWYTSWYLRDKVETISIEMEAYWLARIMSLSLVSPCGGFYQTSALFPLEMALCIDYLDGFG